MSKSVEIDSPLRNKTGSFLLKRRKIRKDVQILVKSKSEIIGLQEVMDESAIRELSCHCISNRSEVYFINKLVIYI